MARPLKLPLTLRIGGVPWTVRFEPLENAYGQSDDQTKTIQLDPAANDHPVNLLDTYLHEVLHSILRQQGRAQEPQEETYVRALATGLIMVALDNPDFLPNLQKGLRP